MSKMGNKLLEMEEQSRDELFPGDLHESDAGFMAASLTMDFYHNIVNLFNLGKTSDEIRQMVEETIKELTIDQGIKELTTDPILENKEK